MGRDNLIVIAATEIGSGLEVDWPLEDKLRKAMLAARHHWLITDENERFRSAVSAAFLKSGTEDRDRILAEMAALDNLSALVSGVAVDISVITIPANQIGLVRLWVDSGLKA